MAATERPPNLDISASRNFVAWLRDRNSSIAFSTYQAAKLFLVGIKENDRLSLFERTFARCMGLWTDGQTFWLASEFQLWRLANVLSEGQLSDGYDRLFVPRAGFTTGDLDVHDIALESDGRIVFVNTRCSCLATLDEKYNFRPIWKPSFISRIAAEDRCHLNGCALRDGRVQYVTACGQTDSVDGWRDVRRGGGCVIDVLSDEVITSGLSMPHSPRYYRDKLWVLESGTGNFGQIDLGTGKFEAITFCPGYVRGMTFIDDFAIIGVSKCRKERTFGGLPLDENLASRNAEPKCGLFVIDLRSGDIVEWLQIEGVIEELYDVAIIPGAVRPKAYGFKTNEIKQQVWLERQE